MGLLLSGKNPAAYKTAERTTFTATAGQTTFTVPVGYNVGDIDVYLNGIRLIDADDFYATNGTTVVLASGANLGDSLVVVCYYNFLNSSSYTKAETDARYVGFGGTTPMTTYLRTPNYGVSSYSDTATASLEASPGAGEQGVGIKAFGRSIATTGGDILYTSDSRGAGGRHRFGYWNGTSFITTMQLDSLGRRLNQYQPGFMTVGMTVDIFNANTGGSSYLYGGTVQYNETSSYNSTNGRFTAPISGRYIVMCSVLINASSGRLEGNISVNGTSKANFNGTGTTYDGPVCVLILNLNANDYVTVQRQSGVAYNNHPQTYFGAYLLG